MLEWCSCQVRCLGIPWTTFPDTKVEHSSKCFPLLFSVIASHNELNVEETPAELTLDAVWDSDINLEKKVGQYLAYMIAT